MEKSVSCGITRESPETVNTSLLKLLVDQGYTPLLTVPILDEHGLPVNTENDSVVALLQKSLGARRVVQLLEAPGFLEDPDDPASVIDEMRFSELEERARSARGAFPAEAHGAFCDGGERLSGDYSLGWKNRQPVECGARRPRHADSMVTNPYELDVYGTRGITLVRGQGARLWDEAGREYLDCMSSHGAAILGHAHPAIVEALSWQAAELASAPGAFHHPQKTRFMERLVELAPRGLARVFLCNSGTESIEAALKLARASTAAAQDRRREARLSRAELRSDERHVQPETARLVCTGCARCRVHRVQQDRESRRSPGRQRCRSRAGARSGGGRRARCRARLRRPCRHPLSRTRNLTCHR